MCNEVRPYILLARNVCVYDGYLIIVNTEAPIYLWHKLMCKSTQQVFKRNDGSTEIRLVCFRNNVHKSSPVSLIYNRSAVGVLQSALLSVYSYERRKWSIYRFIFAA